MGNYSEVKFKKLNMNPFDVETDDCVIRALVAGTLFGYKTICDALKAPFFDGSGNHGGIPIDDIDAFARKYKLIKPFDFEVKDDFDITHRDISDFREYSGFSLGFWVGNLGKVGNLERMIFLLKKRNEDKLPDGESTKYHCVYGNVKSKRYYDLTDTGSLIVFGMYSVDKTKLAKDSDGRYYSREKDAIVSNFEEYRKSLRRS